MPIKVRLPTVLRQYAGGAATVDAEGETLRDVIEDLETNFPGIGSQLVVDGDLHRFVNVYVNDEDVRYLGKLDAKLGESDVVSILPAVAGGAVAAR